MEIFSRLTRIIKKLNYLIANCTVCSQPISIYTAYNISSVTDYGCAASSAPALDQTIYHDGAGVYPVFGDTVWTDPEGTTPLVSPTANDHYYLGDVDGGGFANPNNWLYTDGSGISISISCK